MQNLTYNIKTSLDPEALRQALEVVLGVVSDINPWYINTNSSEASVFNISLDGFAQEDLDSIGSFIESISSFSTKYYTWDSTAKSFSENISAFRNDAKEQIDEEAGKARLRYLTSIPGQDATYMAKEMQCRAYAAAGYPDDLTIYAWVKSEADATGLTAKAAADAIISQADQWIQVGSQIEKVRRSGKIDIDKKLKASTVKTSLAATITALQAI